ncbi:MAG: hypothetical protein ACLQNE_43800 [Thermoguttaceae bacterium]
MKANELLFWLSARRKGSWRLFRDAVERIDSTDVASDSNAMTVPADDRFPLYQRLRLDLERLGHVEFFARTGEKRWRVAPPILAGHAAGDSPRAVLCGARSPELCRRVVSATGELSPETFDFSELPQVIRVTAPDRSALASLARRAGICFQDDAPFAILSCLPPCDPPTRRQPQSEFPSGKDWTVREFDPTALRWQPADRRRAQTARTGLFQLYISFQPALFFLRWHGATYKVPRSVAVYVLLRRTRPPVVRYDAVARALSLPGVCQPPRLLERALVLCSGFPPSFEPATSRLTYSEVPPDIARLATDLLRQRLT